MPSDDPGDPYQGKTILLVEDNAILAMSEELLLRKRGMDVARVLTGEAAVRHAQHGGPIDLVLMDIDLGSGMDGTEAAARILELRSVPVVFLTAHSEREMVEKVKGITRYGYVLKSAGEFVLLEAIAMAFELFGAHEAMAAEIASRRRTEEELLRRNHFIETVLEHLPIGLAVNYIDEGRATYMNDRFQEIYGWPREVITDIATFFEHVYPDESYRTEIMARIMSDIASGDPARMHWDNIMITRSDGARRLVSASNIPIPEQNYMISTVQDQTEYVVAERLYRALVAACPVGFFRTDRAGTIVDCNPRYQELSGYTEAELIGLHEDELWLTPDRGPGVHDVRHRRQDGSSYPVRVVSASVEDGSGGMVYFVDPRP